MLFVSVFATVALGTSLANAIPSSGPIEGGLEARHGNSCGYNDFWYSKKSRCVKNGGDTPGTPGYVLFACVSKGAELSPQRRPILPQELLLAQELQVRIPVSSQRLLGLILLAGSASRRIHGTTKVTSLNATKATNGTTRRTAAILPNTAATTMSFGGTTVVVV